MKLFYFGFGETMAKFYGEHVTPRFDEFSYERMNKSASRAVQVQGALSPYALTTWLRVNRLGSSAKRETNS
jgi:hypothetical protein